MLVVVVTEQQVLDRNHADQRPVLGDVAGVDGLLVDAGAADPGDGLGDGHLGPEGDILRGHDGAGGVLGVAQDLVDGLAHLGVGLAQDAADHGGGHLLDDVHGVVHEELVQDLLQLGIREAPDQQLLGLLVHLHEGVRRQLLGEQTVEQGEAVLLQLVKNGGNVRRVHGDQDLPEGGVFLLRQQLAQGVLHDHGMFCHWVYLLFIVV